jgi:AraC-like DNA-binding protein
LYKPQSALLQDHIDCIYTLRRDAQDLPTRYASFPSMFAMVCVNADTKFEMQGTNLTFSHLPFPSLQTRLVCNYTHSSWIKYEGPADEIVIYFKPLGINAFLDRPLSDYGHAFFVDFSPFDDYRGAMTEIMALDGDRQRLAALEDYWTAKFRGFEHPFLHQVVSEMLADAGSFSIAEAAGRHHISRTTLTKHFTQHIGTTPSQFRKVIRFRNAMKRRRQAPAAENLTDISHGVEYFDQSHMVKDFKALTKYSPKAFFSRLSTLGDGEINWVFLPAS